VAEIVNKVLVPVYPCAMEQRLGQGGEGGEVGVPAVHGVNEVEKAPSVVSIREPRADDVRAGRERRLRGYP